MASSLITLVLFEGVQERSEIAMARQCRRSESAPANSDDACQEGAYRPRCAIQQVDLTQFVTEFGTARSRCGHREGRTDRADGAGVPSDHANCSRTRLLRNARSRQQSLRFQIIGDAASLARRTAFRDRTVRDEFDCGDEDMNRFLRRYARQGHEQHSAMTFCAIDDANPGRVLGFYTLTPAIGRHRERCRRR